MQIQCVQWDTEPRIFKEYFNSNNNKRKLYILI